MRALDTARLACEALGGEPVTHAALSGGFDADDVRELTLATGPDKRLLLVGHNPDFEQVVYDLTGATIDLKKGGIAAVRTDGRGGMLIALLRPREIARIAG